MKETYKKNTYDNRGGNWNDEPISQGMSSIASNLQQWWEEHGADPRVLQKELTLLAPGLWTF